MVLEKTTTPEGMDIYVDTMPDRQVAKITAFVGVGSVHESDKLAGMSHVLEHCTHLSTEMFPDEEALNEFTGINSLDANADTYYNRTCYYATGPHVEPNMKRLGELLFRATFKEEYIPNELSVVTREAYESRDDIDRLHDVACDYALFGKPYGRSVIGYADRINFSAEQLRKFYDKHYTMSNMALIAVGKVHMEEALQYAEKYFGHSKKERYVANKKSPRQIEAVNTGLLVNESDIAIVRYATPMNTDFAERYLRNKQKYDAAIRAIGGLCYRRFRIDTGLSYDGSVNIYDLNDPVAWSIGGNATVSSDDAENARILFEDIFSRPSSFYGDTAIASAIGQTQGETLGSMDSVVDRMELYIQDLEHQVEARDLGKVAESVQNLSHDDVRGAIDDIVECMNSVQPSTHITGPKKAILSADKLFRISKFS